MKILLVNSNPVVSRLTALSARKESVDLDEIRNISELKKSDYNIVFVDSEAFSSELATVLKNSGIKRKVLFYTQDDKEKDKIFNYTILKPFLPSEVSAILREAKIEIDEEENSKLSSKKEEPKEEYLDLNELISSKKDDLAPLTLLKDEPKEKESDSNLKETEERLLEELNAQKSKLDNIKESFDLGLEKEFIPTKEEKKVIEPEPIIEKKDDFNNDLFELDTLKTTDSKETIDNDLFIKDSEGKSVKEDKDELLTLDIDSKNEVNFEEITEVEKVESKKIESKKESVEETKILDKDEISNIKNLLNSEQIDDNLSLEDVMTTPPPPPFEPKVEEKKPKKEDEIKESKKEDNCMETPKVAKRVFKDTVGSLPIEELRQLLRGTKIHITIEFPKEV